MDLRDGQDAPYVFAKIREMIGKGGEVSGGGRGRSIRKDLL